MPADEEDKPGGIGGMRYGCRTREASDLPSGYRYAGCKKPMERLWISVWRGRGDP